MEVNFFAVVAVTKAFLPLLRRTPESRVVNVSSLAGITGSPALGPYCASKHAVEGMTKCVREELSHWSIHMSNINPGFMRTPILTNGTAAARRSFEAAPQDITSEYTTEWMEGQMETMNKLSEDPVLVVNAIIAALTDTHPPLWYFPGKAAAIMRIGPLMCSGLIDMLRVFTSQTCAKPTPEAIKKYRQ
jgi:NAD(P)-dependent dehydrogenase (short-subunit alcohol dehydrogenase family)